LKECDHEVLAYSAFGEGGGWWGRGVEPFLDINCERTVYGLGLEFGKVLEVGEGFGDLNIQIFLRGG
jgi:hypothetical protein